MSPQQNVQKLLSARLSEYQAKNPSFSLRAMSRRLGVSPSTVSMVIAGKRPVSLAMATKICDALQLTAKERHAILREFAAEKRARSAKGPSYVELGSDQFKVMSEWYHFGILSLLKTRGFRSDPAWIASRLGVSRPQVREAIDAMKRIGLLVEGPRGGYNRAIAQVTTSDDVADAAVRKSHFQCLELARRSLEQDDVEARDFTYLNFPMSPRLISELKRLIRKFEDDVDARLEKLDRDPDEVYRLAVSLFPLTRPKSERT